MQLSRNAWNMEDQMSGICSWPAVFCKHSHVPQRQPVSHSFIPHGHYGHCSNQSEPVPGSFVPMIVEMNDAVSIP